MTVLTVVYPGGVEDGGRSSLTGLDFNSLRPRLGFLCGLLMLVFHLKVFLDMVE